MVTTEDMTIVSFKHLTT